MFNFQSIMESFYGGKAESEDQQLQKDAFAGNFVQSALDAQLAKNLSQSNAAIAQQNMTHQADLELRNQAANMKNEFNYGMQSMDAQFNYENDFADNQYNRDKGILQETGTQERESMKEKGFQDREQIKTTGAEERKTLQKADELEAGKQNRASARSRSMARSF